MPWKASSVMEERLLFVARLLGGETMTDVCRDFGISRKTGYKIFDRYREQLESLIVRLKAEKPHWGARKICELLSSAARWRCSGSGQEHDPRGSRSARFGQTRPRGAPSCARHVAVARHRGQ
jgi:Homeodomain-like domain